jgi:uncharacterized protein YuzE
MNVEYDNETDVLYIRTREGMYAYSEEVNENVVIDLQ